MFRFSIRELMLVILVVALGLGWWIERTSLKRESRRANDRYSSIKSVIEMEGASLRELDDGAVFVEWRGSSR